MAEALIHWEEIADRGWTGILLGNGLSRTFWSRFSYESLLRVAKTSWCVENPITSEDARLFDELETSNFESVLRATATAMRVNTIQAVDSAPAEDAYVRVREALIEAVNWVHPPWAEVPEDKLRQLRKSLGYFESVFTTNYDLLIYWAVMSEDSGKGFKDFFWNKPLVFDITDVEPYGSPTMIYYLHGALHLQREPTGVTRKRSNDGATNLLEGFQSNEPGEAWPLFVSEGTAEDKLRAIRTSDYLTFALEALSEQSGDLVIHGHSLDESDRHLVDALQSAPLETVAVAIHVPTTTDLLGTMYGYKKLLSKKYVMFYDSQSHPLGDPSLTIR